MKSELMLSLSSNINQVEFGSTEALKGLNYSVSLANEILQKDDSPEVVEAVKAAVDLLRRFQMHHQLRNVMYSLE